MCLNLCNTLRTPRAREGHFRREAWDLHRRLPLFCLLGSRSTRKRRKQQSATTSFITVLSEFCINQLCHVMPPPLSNSSEHPQHVTAYICLEFWPSHQCGTKKSPPKLTTFTAKWRSRWWPPPAAPPQVAAVANRASPQGCTCESCESSKVLWNLNRKALHLYQTESWPMAHGWIGSCMWHSRCEIFDIHFNISIFSLLSFSAWETEKHIHFHIPSPNIGGK